jgi:hypothetical protein
VSDNPITAAGICAEAMRLVSGSRAATHGDKRENFSKIAALWNGYWQARWMSATVRELAAEPWTPFDAKSVGDMLELMKIARRLLGEFNIDDYTDSAGYAACTGEIALQEATAKLRKEELRKEAAALPVEPVWPRAVEDGA